jgi:hypothetical protein
MGASTVAVGIEGGEEFGTAADLRPSETLILLIDAAEDVPGAFGRRQNDVRAALDGDGALVLLVGPCIADGLATQFGCWIRAKVGLDILPWAQPRALAESGQAHAEIRFFGEAPPSAETIARAESGQVAGVRYRGGGAKIIVAPLDAIERVSELLPS